MVKISDMSDRQRKVFDSVYKGWYMGGEYFVRLADQDKRFWADSLPILFNKVDRWYEEFEEQYSNDHLLVKCVKPL